MKQAQVKQAKAIHFCLLQGKCCMVNITTQFHIQENMLSLQMSWDYIGLCKHSHVKPAVTFNPQEVNIELGGAVGITSIWPKVEFIDKGDEGEYETLFGFVH